jgi:hypothetical protein
MGTILYMETPTLFYRCHENNTFGLFRYDVFGKVRNMLSCTFSNEEYRQCIDVIFRQAEGFYARNLAALPGEKRRVIEAFLELRGSRFLKKLFLVFRYRFFMHHAMGTMEFLLRY